MKSEALKTQKLVWDKQTAHLQEGREWKALANYIWKDDYFNSINYILIIKDTILRVIMEAQSEEI